MAAEGASSDLRIVLLGNIASGKSSSGNTILGREEFDLKTRTAQCVKRQGEVAGRQVTVVEAPGWWKNKNLTATPELTKEEIVLSVSLCPPGPHAVLLVIRVGYSITEDYRANIQQHLELLSEGVWSHTMVLFTYGDWLGDTIIEQRIESEGALQSLVKKCGNRYHVLNNINRTDDQVKQLFEKIEEMMAGKENCHFEMDRKQLQETQERRRKEEGRARERLMEVKKKTEHLQILKRDSPSLTEFRLVLLGNRFVGKRSSGNTILGREEFDLKRRTAQCVKRQGEVAGRQVIVVKAPGWWININLTDTPELTKEEIVVSVSLCPPGPHVVLLVIQVDSSVTEEMRANIQQHLELLTERVWSHTMVLFTRGDWLGDTTIEQRIESEADLQSLVEKCGNRYHVLNNINGTDEQVTELFEKIEDLVARNSGHHYEMDRKRLLALEERKKQQMQRAEDRQTCVYRQRASLKFSAGDIPHLSSMRIVLLGHRNAGKSSSGNTILGREEFDLKTKTAQSVMRQGEVAGRQITVVKAPGWRKNHSAKDIPKVTRKQIIHSVSLCPPGPHAILLVIWSDVSFSEESRKNIVKCLKLFSDDIWSHTIVLFTCGEWLGDTTIEQHIESEGEALKWLIEKCGNRYHVLNNKDRTDRTQVNELLEKIEEIVVMNSNHHYVTGPQQSGKTVKDGLFNWKKGEQKTKMDKMTKHLTERIGELELEGSMSSPLNMSEDSRSSILTVGTSGYGTVSSSWASSFRSSIRSTSSVSSGIGSFTPLAHRSSARYSVNLAEEASWASSYRNSVRSTSTIDSGIGSLAPLELRSSARRSVNLAEEKAKRSDELEQAESTA